jgi:3-demethylubiquinone-9 3-methyltransferase
VVRKNKENLEMNKITPFLWFDTQAEEAMNFYVDTFNGAPYKKQESRIVNITRYEKGMDAPGADELEGKVITGVFELAGQRFMALDGGPKQLHSTSNVKIRKRWITSGISCPLFPNLSNAAGSRISTVSRGRSSRNRWVS